MESSYDGLLVLDKPAGMTSRDAVNCVQPWFPRGTRIGHTGTLDPLATGVLVVCVGLATRLAEYVQRMTKVYRAGVVLGAVSDTDDADGAITPRAPAIAPALAAVAEALRGFLGEIEQVPPVYSAAKVTGCRAYALARKGKEVSLAPRRVTVHEIVTRTYEYPLLELLVRCGKGTYIRSLARDLGQLLGCGGYITSLRRLQVGCFTETEASSLTMNAAEARQRLLPMAMALHDVPRVTLAGLDAERLLHGGSVALERAVAGEVAVFDEAGRLLAVAECAEGCLRPSKVMRSSDQSRAR